MTGVATYDVCVVGLGPTGMTLAHLLAVRGANVLVLERDEAPYGMARAVYTDDQCLRIMQNAGLADELHADMLSDLPVQWVRADGSVLGQFRSPGRPHGWPISNFLHQPTFEGTLERRLADHPSVEVRRGRALVDFAEDADGVTVRHRAPDGDEVEEVRSSYLVGADGGRSTVRGLLGIEMQGRSFPQRWLVIDLAAAPGSQPFAHLPYFDFVCDAELPTVSCPQPGGRHRFEFMLHDDDSTEAFSDRVTAERLMARYVDVDSVVIERQLVYTFNALVARQWRRGRVLLAGDAAHMSPQFIGQGMNAGVRDADNLSWKLIDVLQHGVSPAVLDSYEAERRPHAQAMIDLSVFNKEVVSMQSRALRGVREVGMWGGTRLPGLRSWIGEAKMKPRPRLRRDTHLGMPRRLRGVRGVEATLMPQFEVRDLDAAAVRLDDVSGHGWVVMGIGIDPREVVDTALWQQMGARHVCLYPPGSRPSGRAVAGRARIGVPACEAVDRAASTWLRRAGADIGSVVVLRPDKFVWSVTGPGEHHLAEQQVRRQLLAGARAVDAAVV